MGVIYLRTNLANGKQYVGQTVNFRQREYDWSKRLNRDYAGVYINNAREKYGTENWSVEILKECDTEDELNEWERYYIKKLNTKAPNGYNLSDGGEGCSGWIMPEEQRVTLSEIRKGSNNPMYGKLPWNALIKPPKSFGEAVSRGLKGKTKGIKKSEEHKHKIGLAHAKAIIQLTLKGEFVKEWESAAEAGRHGFNFSSICACCRGERNKHNGFKWMFKSEYEKRLGLTS